jgi:DNA-binding response OmpR family regulator
LSIERPSSDWSESPRRPVILVADDDDSVRALLERGLEQAGFEVWAVRNGQEAVALYRQRGTEIDLVLLDVRMPELDGPHTFAALRRENPGVRCCFISGHSGVYTREDLLSMGAEYFFRKPFSLQDLAARIHELVHTNA